jgi:ribosomal protein S27E
MPAVRCKECLFVAAKNEGFCPECGAMYVEPLDLVDESEALKSVSRPAYRPEKKKGGGLFGSLFGGSKGEKTETASVTAAAPSRPASPPPDIANIPRDQLKIRCQECKHITAADGHDDYCPSCGAFFVEPLTYVTPEMLAAEAEQKQAEIAVFKKQVKTFAEMSPQEQLNHLKEDIADIWDKITKDRHVLNVKANECMQCFTAAGTIKTDNPNEELASMIKQRYHNLQEFEMLNTEYRRMLDAFSAEHDRLRAAQQRYAEHEQALKAAQPSA